MKFSIWVVAMTTLLNLLLLHWVSLMPPRGFGICDTIFVTLQNLQSIVLTPVFGVCLCVGVGVCVCVCVCVSNNFLVYSITKTILPGSSPHLLRTFLASIPSFRLILGSFRKTRWPPCLFFYSIFSHWLSIGD